MSEAPTKKQDQFIVRLPDGMRDRIKVSAENNGRSMNAEIVQALDEVIPDLPPKNETAEMLRFNYLLDMHLDNPEPMTPEERQELDFLIEKYLKAKK